VEHEELFFSPPQPVPPPKLLAPGLPGRPTLWRQAVWHLQYQKLVRNVVGCKLKKENSS